MKLRRGLGKGKAVPLDQLIERLRPFDTNGDGSLELSELVTFFKKHRVGGPWFCEVLGKTIWRTAEEHWAQEIKSITIDALARVLSYSMMQPPRPEERYMIDPEVMLGLKPRTPLDKSKAKRPPPPQQGQAGPRSSSADGGPRGPGPSRPAGTPMGARPQPRAGSGRPVPRRPGPKPRQ